MNIDGTQGGTGVHAALDLSVVVSETLGIELAAEYTINEVLPGHWDAESIQSAVFYEAISASWSVHGGLDRVED